MLPTKLQVTWPPSSKEDAKNRFSRWPTLWPSWLIVLGFNDMSTLVGHFVSSPREREKRYRRDSRRNERERQGRKRKRSEREEIKTFPFYPYLLQG